MKSLLSIRTNPDGAQVSLEQDGQRVVAGPAPFAYTVDSGIYRIIVEHPEYRTVEQRMRIRAGKVYVLIVEMSQGHFLGYLSVESTPPGASVFVDDRERGAAGQTPWGNVLPAGSHRVWVDRPGYEVVEREVEVELGDQEELEVELERVRHGRIRVNANIAGSTVHVDGREMGRVPWEGDVDAGPHQLRVSSEGMKSYEAQVVVERGQLTPVEARLRPAPSRASAWVTTSLAVVMLGAGITLGVLSNDMSSTLAGLRDQGMLTSNDPRIVEGQAYAIGADIAFGLTALFGGLALYYFLADPLPDSSGRVREPRDWTVAPAIGPGLAGGAFMGSF